MQPLAAAIGFAYRAIGAHETPDCKIEFVGAWAIVVLDFVPSFY